MTRQKGLGHGVCSDVMRQAGMRHGVAIRGRLEALVNEKPSLVLETLSSLAFSERRDPEVQILERKARRQCGMIC